MSRAKSSVELANVFRMHEKDYRSLNKLTIEQHRVINAILNCRTSALGGHVYKCDHCGELHISYNSCRNRHCPKYQSLSTLQWLENRRKELLPVQYFHVVFTLPHELNNLILYNKRLLYGLLFQSAWETVNTLGKNPNRLNGLMGMMAILHTWSQNLLQHNHLHCIVPGGAVTKTGKWKSSKKGYLFPVKVMSKIFRGIYVSHLRSLYEEGKLKPPNKQQIKYDFDGLLSKLMKKDWVVYSKEPFAGPEKLLDYLGRYTHKIAISNNRILTCNTNAVTFKWRDYSDDNKEKIMKLHPCEFMRRFLLHVVPTGFMRIRSFGFLASACKKKNVKIIRKEFSYCPKKIKKEAEKIDVKLLMEKLTGIDINLCSKCKKGTLRHVDTIPSKFGRTKNDTS